MTATTPREVLDALDRQLILLVHGYRKQYSTGPTWAEIRPRELPRPDLSSAAFNKYWDNGGEQAYEEGIRPFQFYRANHPDQSEEGARKRWRKQAYSRWRRDQLENDPLAVRLRRLRQLGYLSFTTKEHSLDVGPLVKARTQKQTTDTSTTTPSPPPSSVAFGQLTNNRTAFGQLTNGSQNGTATWHVLRWDQGWTTVCSASTARPGLAIVKVADKPGEPLCRLKRCERALTEWESRSS